MITKNPYQKNFRSYLPQYCLLCKKSCLNDPLCSPCQQDLPWLTHNHCHQCAQSISNQTNSMVACGQCLNHPPPFKQTLVLFEYQPPIKSWIHQCKHTAPAPLITLLTKLMREKITQHYMHHDLPQTIIAMPQHPKRTRQRGFNLSVIFAKKIANQLAIHHHSALITRQRNHPKQALLNKTQRLKNIHAKDFYCAPTSITTCALIDDVMTTGTSAKSACHALQKSGINTIDLWCLARA
jgi:ComF family protein